MRKLVRIAIFVIILFITHSFQKSITQTQIPQSKTHQAIKPQDASKELKVDLDYGMIPLYFIANRGQVDEDALFYAKASRYTLWLTKEELIFDSTRRIEEEDSEYAQIDLRGAIKTKGFKYKKDVSRLRFLDVNRATEVVAEDMTEHRVNYLIGNDESKWKRDIQTSRAVLYREVYQNVDLKVYGVEKEVEYDWVVRRGGEVEKIRFEYRSVKETRIDDRGNLVVETEFGEVMHRKPESYQVIDGERIGVEARFKELAENVYGFEVGSYSEAHDLVIDPIVLLYSTYLGGNNIDYGRDIAVDSAGNAYVAGETSTNFPTVNPFSADPDGMSTDAFVTKLSAAGNSLIYSTYLGGTGHDGGVWGIAVDSAGNAYVTGITTSHDFPTVNPYMSDMGACDAFVTKLSAAGNSLVYSTYLGGSDIDGAYDIAIDAIGNAYVTGTTYSTDFPTVNEYMSDPDGLFMDAFVTAFAPSGDSLWFSTYIGGDGDFEEGDSIAIDGTLNTGNLPTNVSIFVTGVTTSTDFPTVNAYMSYPGEPYTNAFVSKFNFSVGLDQSKTLNLIYSTYLGGDGGDEGRGIALDSAGNAYVTGRTGSTDFPTKNPYMTWPEAYNISAFVTKLSAAGNSLLYSTYFGGWDADYCWDIKLDSAGNVYLIGETMSTDFPTLNAYMGDPRDGYGKDVFVTKLSLTKNRLMYSTYLGGDSDEEGRALALDNAGNIYITGSTYSSDFPTVNEFMNHPGGSYTDAFVSKFSTSYPPDFYIFDSHDFDGDSDSDASVFRPSNGRWHIKAIGSYTWGQEGDIPVNGDYNGDGITEIAVWRHSNGRWYLRDVGVSTWGAAGDIPVPGNYDGDIDETTDIAVWRPYNGKWYIQGMGTYSWGVAGDIPVPGDYNGDGTTDIAVWRPSNGRWYIKGLGSSAWGISGDIPIPGDFDGDGETDIAVWRPSNGRWYILGMAGSSWGTAGDVPAPGDYNGDGITDIAVWRPSNGRWYIKGIGGYLWGILGDIPLVR